MGCRVRWISALKLNSTPWIIPASASISINLRSFDRANVIENRTVLLWERNRITTEGLKGGCCPQGDEWSSTFEPFVLQPCSIAPRLAPSLRVGSDVTLGAAALSNARANTGACLTFGFVYKLHFMAAVQWLEKSERINWVEFFDGSTLFRRILRSVAWPLTVSPRFCVFALTSW